MVKPVKDIEVIRGDSFSTWVGLANGWDEVTAAPELYQGRLVLREEQDDSLAEILVMPSDLIEGTDTRFPSMTHMMLFEATPVQTQALPEWQRLVCFCELRALDDSYVRRLFDGKVKVRD